MIDLQNDSSNISRNGIVGPNSVSSAPLQMTYCASKLK